VLIKIGFTPNKVCILGAALREQFPKNLQRFAKAGNRDLFSATKLSSFILTPEHKQTALISHEKASILRYVI
jgi:hypothetical protein